MWKKILGGDESGKELWKRYDCEFHLALIQAYNSSNLLSLHATLYDKYLRYQMLVLTNRGEEAIFDAAVDRDSVKAQTLLEIHIIKGLEHTLERM